MLTFVFDTCADADSKLMIFLGNEPTLDVIFARNVLNLTRPEKTVMDLARAMLNKPLLGT